MTYSLYFLCALITCPAPAQTAAQSDERSTERRAELIDFAAQPHQLEDQFRLSEQSRFISMTEPTGSAHRLPKAIADQDVIPRIHEEARWKNVDQYLRADFARSSRAVPVFLQSTYAPLPTFAGCSASAYKPAYFLSRASQKRRHQLYPLVNDAACRNGIPVDLFDAVIIQESRYDFLARSPVGAFGLAQLMPGTARDLGANRYVIASNLDGGARYLKSQMRRFASVPLALAAYNAGPARVAARLAIPNIRETKNYVANILNMWRQLSLSTPRHRQPSEAREIVSAVSPVKPFDYADTPYSQKAHRSAAVLHF
jgi:Transglycosylase SLT domain